MLMKTSCNRPWTVLLFGNCATRYLLVGLVFGISLLVGACDQFGSQSESGSSSPDKAEIQPFRSRSTAESQDYLALAIKAREDVVAYSFKEVVRRNKDDSFVLAALGHVGLPHRLVKLGLAGRATFPRWPYCGDQVIFSSPSNGGSVEWSQDGEVVVGPTAFTQSVASSPAGERVIFRSPEFSEFRVASQETICFERHPLFLMSLDGSEHLLEDPGSGWQMDESHQYHSDLMYSPEHWINEAVSLSETRLTKFTFTAASESSSGLNEISMSWTARNLGVAHDIEFNLGFGQHDHLIRNLSMVSLVPQKECLGPGCIQVELRSPLLTEIQIEFFDYEVGRPGIDITTSSDREILWPGSEAGAIGPGVLDDLVAQVWRLTRIERAPPELESLAELYRATAGHRWSNNQGWLSDQPLSTWHGVTTDRDGRVAGLDLSDNNLVGELPTAIQQLANLESLDLSRNQLIGPIPAGLGNLESLQFLDLSSNQLTGRLPPELGKLKNLHVFDVARNRRGNPASATGISGPIPPELGDLFELRNLNLSENALVGGIPPELGDLPKLRELDLSYNNLEGVIPPELGTLRNLNLLNLSVNHLEGGIPPELGDLPDLQRVDVSSNKLVLNYRGAIAPALRELIRLGQMSIGGQRT